MQQVPEQRKTAVGYVHMVLASQSYGYHWDQGLVWLLLTCMGREYMLVSTSFRAREYLSSPNVLVRLF